MVRSAAIGVLGQRQARFQIRYLLHQGAALRFLMSRLAERFNRPQEALVTTHDPDEYLQKLNYHLKHDIRRETEAA